MKKPAKFRIRNKADKFLQDYIRIKHGDNPCWVCNKRPVICGHHYIPKSNSSATRFYLPNIIPICKECHYLAHNQSHLVTPVIDFKLGQEWYEDLIIVKRQIINFTKEWATEQYEKMKELYQEVC